MTSAFQIVVKIRDGVFKAHGDVGGLWEIAASNFTKPAIG